MDGNSFTGLENVEIDDVFSLIPSQATLEQARDFLRRRNLEYSAGSWSDMISRRLQPKYEEKKISKAELVNFLCDAEEFGNQHVLLYQAPLVSIQDWLNESNLRSRLASDHIFPALNERNVIDLPSANVIAEVRKDQSIFGECLVVKQIERRYVRMLETTEEWAEGEYLHSRVKTEPYRAANIVRVHPNGICEVRIHSNSDNSSYDLAARGLLRAIGPLVDFDKLKEFSLEKVRAYIWEPKHREEAKSRFSLRSSEHLDGKDGRLRPSSSSRTVSMLDNDDLVRALDAYSGSASVHRANLTLKPIEELKRGLNVNLTGADNEFFITAKATREEYEYILATILNAHEAMTP